MQSTNSFNILAWTSYTFIHRTSQFSNNDNDDDDDEYEYDARRSISDDDADGQLVSKS